MALQVQARELLPRTAHRWNGPTTRAATSDSVGALRLGVRPVTRTEAGWARGALTWQSLPHVRNRLNLDPVQHRWACELGALYRAAVPAAAGQDPDWLFLDEAPNPLVWELLRQGEALGVPLVAPGSGSARLGGRGVARARRRAGRRRGSGSSPRLALDGDAVPVELAHAVGDHGVWATGDSPTHVVLAPFAAPIDPALLDRDPLVVPAEAADELRTRWIPALQDRFARRQQRRLRRRARAAPAAAGADDPHRGRRRRDAHLAVGARAHRRRRPTRRPSPRRCPTAGGRRAGCPAPRTLTAEEALDFAADVGARARRDRRTSSSSTSAPRLRSSSTATRSST